LDISIIIVNWNTKDLLMECLASIFETVKKVTVEVWLVDNASIDGSVEAAKNKYPDINVIQNERNLGFAAANNLAFKQMKGSYALLLNTDATLIDSAAKELYNFMEANPKVGIACGQLLNTDGSKQNSIANYFEQRQWPGHMDQYNYRRSMDEAFHKKLHIKISKNPI